MEIALFIINQRLKLYQNEKNSEIQYNPYCLNLNR
jgi:hypothetical protein